MTKGLDGKIVCEKHQWPTKDCVLCMSAVYEKEQVADLMRSRVGALEARIAELEAYCEKAEYELDWHSDELRKLEAENQRLRDTILYAKGRMKAYGIVDARIDLPGVGNE